jgi:mannose-6-phosphate isomerase-like protein (cupin superfamily)
LPTILPYVPTLIPTPTIVQAAGNKPKIIREFVGRVNSATSALSIAQMQSPGGWIEPGQTPEFDEYTLVIRGTVRVEYTGGVLDVQAGQAVLASAGEWVQYSTPGAEGADYVSVCLPAFSPQLVHRDE